MSDTEKLQRLMNVAIASLTIKTPQLIGIVAGCIVFTVTIGVVVYLLYASGSFAKLAEEMSSNQTPAPSNKGKVEVVPQFSSQPELYEELLRARKSLPTRPQPPSLAGNAITVRVYNHQLDNAEVVAISDGRAIFHESAYNPARLAGWLDLGDDSAAATLTSSLTADPTIPTNGCHMCIVDKELKKIIGMLSLVDNSPRNLSIRIDNVWITPAFQGKKRAHEAVLLVLQWLHASGYRRIVAEVEERHQIGRKFLERCGFQCEAVLRKHKVLHQRNSNTALYTVLNSDFLEVEKRLKTYLGWSLAPKMHKIAEVESAGAVKSAAVEAGKGGASGGSSKKNEKKKSKRKSSRANITW